MNHRRKMNNEPIYKPVKVSLTNASHIQKALLLLANWQLWVIWKLYRDDHEEYYKEVFDVLPAIWRAIL